MTHRGTAGCRGVIWLGWALSICVWASVSFAQTATASGASNSAASALPSSDDGRTLTIGVGISPPFVMSSDNGKFTGISIALWQRVADKLGVESHYVKRDLHGLFSGLENHSLDVSIAALTVTEPRESRIDFTFPFYSTGLAIAVPTSGGGSVWATVSRFFSWQFFTAVATLAGLLLLAGFGVWAFERRRNADEFGGNIFQGLASGFWWAAVTMTTVGYGDKSPRTFGGRIIGLIWMFAAIIIISSLTAAIATSLTVSKLSSGIQNVQDLSHARVATVDGSAAAGALRDRGIVFEKSASLNAALADLAAGRVDAVVYDAPLLKYRVRQNYAGRLSVLPRTFERQEYAFALPQGSELREPINRAILSVINTSDWNNLVARYVGTP